MKPSPAVWPSKRLRFVADVNPGKIPAAGLADDALVSFLPMENVGVNGDIDLSEEREASHVKSGYTSFINGDVIVAKITPCFENGKGALVRGLRGGIGLGSTEFHVIRSSDSVDARFLYYVTASRKFRDTGAAEMRGAAGQQRVTPDFIKNYQVETPSIEQQRRIANWLDIKMADIDRAIDSTESLIEKLRIHRSAKLRELSTKGAVASVRKVSSGIDWIGDVPSHWKVARSGLYAHWGSGDFISPEDYTIDATPECSIPVIGGNGVMGYTDRFNSSRETVIIGRVGQYCGNVRHHSGKGFITDNALRLRYHHGFYLRYLSFVLEAADLNRGSMQSAQPLITGTKIKTITLPMPPIAEQVAIADAIVSLFELTERRVALIRIQIEKLRRYRQSLITAAVTGQVSPP